MALEKVLTRINLSAKITFEKIDPLDGSRFLAQTISAAQELVDSISSCNHMESLK